MGDGNPELEPIASAEPREATANLELGEGAPAEHERPVVADSLLVTGLVAPEPSLPPHLELSLSSLLGGSEKLAEYRQAPEYDRLKMLQEALAPRVEEPQAVEDDEENAEADSPVVDLEQAKLILDQITERTQQQMTAKGAVEVNTDRLARVSALASSWRRLGSDKVRGWLGVGLGFGGVVVTNTALRSAEFAMGTGGVLGAGVGSLGYQAIYQRTIENRWQRGQSIWRTGFDRVARLASFATNRVEERDKLAAEKEFGRVDEAKTMLGRGWRRAQHWVATHQDAYARRAYAEERKVHLQPEQVADLPKPELLRRLAEGRLALTRHDRRVEQWQDPELNKRSYQIETYTALLRRAAVECTPQEIRSACRKVELMTGVHLLASVAAGVLGGFAGYFGAKAWHEAHPQAVEPTVTDNDRIIVASGHHLPKAPTEAPKVVPNAAPVAPVAPSGPDLAQHLQRANLLEHYGAGHYTQSGFDITAPHQINEQGNGWIEVNHHRLAVTNGETDVRALVSDRVSELQQQVTGANLAEIYAPGVDQTVVDQAIHLKDALAQHLVEQQVYGQSQLDPTVHEALAGVGYDFNLNDTHDVRQEIHQAMAKWLNQKQALASATTPSAAPVAPVADAVPSAATDLPRHAGHEHTRPIARGHYSAKVNHLDRQAVNVRPAAHQTTAPVSEQPVTSIDEYTGWHLPTDQDAVITTPKEVERLTPARLGTAHPRAIETNTTDVHLPVAKPPIERPTAAPSEPISAPRQSQGVLLDDFFKDKPIKAADIEGLAH